MTLSAREEQRALDQGEQQLVAGSHHPQLGAIGDDELRDLVRRLRQVRDRARDDLARRRRERRGKAAPKGAAASRSEEGTSRKLEALSGAVRRVNAEVERRRSKARKQSTAAAARKAMAMRDASEDRRGRPFPPGRTPDEGLATETPPPQTGEPETD
ncbi:MAG: hypothetical protein ACOCYE_13195 [Pseudomonadota bacterium]